MKAQKSTVTQYSKLGRTHGKESILSREILKFVPLGTMFVVTPTEESQEVSRGHSTVETSPVYNGMSYKAGRSESLD